MASRILIALVLVSVLLATAGCPATAPPSTAPAPSAQAPPPPPPPPAKPAELKAQSLKVTPVLVLPGQKATVEATISNAGEVKGTLAPTLNVNGVPADSRVLTLDPGASSTVSFSVTRDAPGKYDLSLGGANAALTVADVETYRSKSFYYSVSYPKGWTLDEDDPESVSMTRPDGGSLYVGFEIGSTAATQEEYVKEQLEVFSRESGTVGLKPSLPMEIKRDGQTYGYRFTYSFKGATGNWVGSGLAGTRGRFGFFLTAQMPEADYAANKSLLEACLDSFRPPATASGSYANGAQGISLELPKGWEALETGAAMPLAYLVSPLGQPAFGGTLFVQRLQQSATGKDYVVSFANIYKNQSGFKIQSEGEASVRGGAQGYEIVFTFTRDGVARAYRVLGVIRGTQAFVLVLSGQTSAFEGARSALDQIVRSFTLDEPKPFGVSRQNSLYLYHGEITSLDPAVTEDSPEDVVGAIFSGLVRLDKDQKAVPDLAESWKTSPDGKTYAFQLRKGLKFHDGKPVTAQDVKYSWERATDPKTKSTKARTYLGDIVGAADRLAGKADQLSGVRVIDDLTLEVMIDGPKPYFLDKLSYVTAYVVDRANVARGMNWTDEPNGTGPYRMKQWKKGELLVLEAFKDYYLGMPRIDSVVVQIFAGRPMMMYERGEIDIATVSVNDLERVTDPAGTLSKELLAARTADTSYLAFNVTMPPFDDLKVRQAFALAVNADKILEVTLKGNALRAAGFVPPGVPAHNPELKPLAYEPERARKLLEESKYGGPGRLPEVTLYVPGAAGPVNEAIVSMWKQNLGVDVKVEAVKEIKEYFERRHRGEFQIFVSGWRADYNDPQNFLEVLFQTGSEENASRYSNPDVDAALKEAAAQLDRDKRLKMYQEIEKAILKDLPAAPLWQGTKTHVLVKPYVKGLQLGAGALRLWDMLSISR